MFIPSTCFFNNLTTSLVFTELPIISYSLNPLLATTDNMSKQKYYVKILILSLKNDGFVMISIYSWFGWWE